MPKADLQPSELNLGCSVARFKGRLFFRRAQGQERCVAVSPSVVFPFGKNTLKCNWFQSWAASFGSYESFYQDNNSASGQEKTLRLLLDVDESMALSDVAIPPAPGTMVSDERTANLSLADIYPPYP